jgi:hypothetical protein
MRSNGILEVDNDGICPRLRGFTETLWSVTRYEQGGCDFNH